jgi:hypothetical protein
MVYLATLIKTWAGDGVNNNRLMFEKMGDAFLLLSSLRELTMTEHGYNDVYVYVILPYSFVNGTRVSFFSEKETQAMTQPQCSMLNQYYIVSRSDILGIASRMLN